MNSTTFSSGGIVPFFSIGGAYSLKWQGLPVRYAFFYDFRYPGLILSLLLFKKQHNVLRLFTICIALFLPFCDILIQARRNALAWFIIVVLSYMYFSRRFILPRFFPIIGLLFAFLAITTGPYYREFSQLGIKRSEVKGSFTDAISKSYTIEGVDAAENGAYVIGAFDERGGFGYGAIFFDKIVGFFFPRQIFGERLRSLLFFHGGPEWIDRCTYEVYGYSRPANEFYSGPAELFSQFWYFGSLYYFFVGFLLRQLWDRAVIEDCLLCQSLYIGLLVQSMLSIVHSPSTSFVNGLFYSCLIISAFWICRRKLSTQIYDGIKCVYPNIYLNTKENKIQESTFNNYIKII